MTTTMDARREDLDRLAASLREGASERVAHQLAALDAADAADLVRALPPELRDDALLTLPPETASDILEELPDDQAAAAVMDMPPGTAAAIVERMTSDEEADLLQDVDPAQAEAILELLHPDDAVAARALLEHDEDSAGGLMQTELVAIPEGMTAGDVVRRLRERADEYAELPASYLYVVDDDRVLRGVVSLRALLLCDAGTPIAAIRSEEVVAVPPELPGEELLKLFRRHGFLAMPVVDERRRLLGIVTQGDATRFAEEDADEEMLRLSGIPSGDEYREMSLRRRSLGRLSWLSVNVLLNVMAAAVITFYEDTLRQVIALAVFLPIISDMSGCSGNQAVAVSIRELSLDRITPKQFLWVLRKEWAVGLVNGLALGVLVGLLAYVWRGNGVLGLVVGGALWINTLVAVSIGGLVPILLRRFGRDPAAASSPILTTVTDMCGFFLVLGAATQVLPQLQ